MDLRELKASAAKAQEHVGKMLDDNNMGGFDNKFWKHAPDQAGNMNALVRFLPAPNGEDDPFVKVMSYSFKGPTGQWYIEDSLENIGRRDPCNDLWQTIKNAQGAEAARPYSRRVRFECNVAVIRDSGNKENEGKVWLWRFPVTVYRKIEGAMNGDYGDKFNPFDLWTGADFRMVRKVGSNRIVTYDDSHFAEPGPAFKSDKHPQGDEDLMALVWEAAHTLKRDPSEYKSYGELLARLELATGETLRDLRDIAGSEDGAEYHDAPDPSPAAPAAVSDGGDDPASRFKNLGL